MIANLNRTINAPTKKEKKAKNVSDTKKKLKEVPVKKPTHLYLNDKCLTAIENILTPDNLTVIYLHNNSISKIENLDAAINLQHLYLQKNKISKIENLHLEKLTKLYLGHNEISVLEGLENLKNLKVLHIEKQTLNDGDSLCFDARSIMAIAKSLEVLNISHNNISSIECLSPLQFITVADISHNKLMDMTDVCNAVHSWYYLSAATFTGNPVAKQRHYRENIISYTSHLSLLDNKEVTETTRTFIKRFEQEKLNHPSSQSINVPDKVPDIAKSYPMPVQKAISQALLKNTKPCFIDTTLHTDVHEIYLPWKALPKSTSNITGKIHPALRKGKQQKRNANVHTLSSTFPNLS